MQQKLRSNLVTATLNVWRRIRKNPVLRIAALALMRPALPWLRRVIFESRSLNYSEWIKNIERKSRISADLADAVIEKLHHRPLITIIMPCYETPPHFLREAIASIQVQHYPHWELCLVDDASP